MLQQSRAAALLEEQDTEPIADAVISRHRQKS